MLRRIRRNFRNERKQFESVSSFCYKGGYFSSPVLDAHDMLDFCDGESFVYIESEGLFGGSCALEVCDDCVKLYHMKLVSP